MRRFMTLAALALASCAVLSTAAQAQLVQVQYGPPVIYSQPVVPAYYYPAPTYVAPSVSYSYYPARPCTSYYPRFAGRDLLRPAGRDLLGPPSSPMRPRSPM